MFMTQIMCSAFDVVIFAFTLISILEFRPYLKIGF
jgi:hypothetical protein